MLRLRLAMTIPGKPSLAAGVAVLIALASPAPLRAEGPAKESAMAVTVVRAAKRCFTDRLIVSGVFVARRPIEVRADRDGLVVGEVLVEPGDVVAKDQVLARLSAPDVPGQPIDLKAPVAGPVIAEAAIVGAYTSAGTGDPLFRIAADNDLELKAQILATSLPRAHKHMAAKIHVLGLGDMDGRIASIDDGLDAQSQLGSLRILVKPDPVLRVGSFAHADIDAGQDCGLSIPSSALVFSAIGPVVGIVQSDRVVMRAVTTGLLDGGDIEIRDGVMEGDRVIARAGPFLREGDRVQPVSNKP